MSDITEVFEFLDRLRESGATNMFGAGQYVERRFAMGRDEARKVTVQWMETFDPALSPAERAASVEQSK